MNELFFTTFITIALTQALNFHHYEIQRNVKLDIDPFWLIATNILPS